MEIKNGFELSNMEATGLSIGVAKKENNDKVKARFVVLNLRMYLYLGPKKRYFGSPVRHVLFEDELPGTAMQILEKYTAKDAMGQPLKDTKGGVVIDLPALKASAEDYEVCECFLDWPGGAMQKYMFKKGMCYANDANGKPTLDAAGNKVMRDSMDVLVQVVQYIDGMPQYAPGMSLEGRGQRLESRFWRVPVVAETAQTVQMPTQQTVQTMQLGQQPTQQTDPNQPPF